MSSAPSSVRRRRSATASCGDRSVVSCFRSRTGRRDDTFCPIVRRMIHWWYPAASMTCSASLPIAHTPGAGTCCQRSGSMSAMTAISAAAASSSRAASAAARSDRARSSTRRILGGHRRHVNGFADSAKRDGVARSCAGNIRVPAGEFDRGPAAGSRHPASHRRNRGGPPTVRPTAHHQRGRAALAADPRANQDDDAAHFAGASLSGRHTPHEEASP